VLAVLASLLLLQELGAGVLGESRTRPRRNEERRREDTRAKEPREREREAGRKTAERATEEGGVVDKRHVNGDHTQLRDKAAAAAEDSGRVFIRAERPGGAVDSANIEMRMLNDEDEDRDCQRIANKGDVVDITYISAVGAHSPVIFFAGDEIFSSFVLGASPDAPVWADAVEGMCAGEQRELQMPAWLAHSELENSGIPEKATIAILVELIRVRKPKETTVHMPSCVLIAITILFGLWTLHRAGQAEAERRKLAKRARKQAQKKNK